MVLSVMKAWPGMLKPADRALVALPMVAKPATAITTQASTTRRLCRKTMPVSRVTGQPPRPGRGRERQRRPGRRAHRRRAETARLPDCPEQAYNERSVCVNTHGEVTQ